MPYLPMPPNPPATAYLSPYPDPSYQNVVADKHASHPPRSVAQPIQPGTLTRPTQPEQWLTDRSASTATSILASALTDPTSSIAPETLAPEFSAPPRQVATETIQLAQAIVPADDGVGTQVTTEGDRFNIGGGQRSGDGANLFHSLSKFGLSQGQIANFLSHPEIRNILTRVVGGEASIINGKIQITGGNSNLFLINPAGILFGPQASLNVPAAFTATTATAIGFGNAWFNTVGANNYAVLLGSPSHLRFSTPQPGAIVNTGNLTVGSGQSLSLIGGSVLNTGQLVAPEGQLTVAAVPGSSRVRLSSAGSVLALEIEAARNLDQALPPAITPLSLPELLTGGNQQHAAGVSVNANGEVTLQAAGVPIHPTPGTTIVAGELDVSGQTGGNVQVLGQQVGLLGAIVRASGTRGGGTILVGGDYQGRGNLPTARQTYVSPDSTLQADALQAGNGGRVIVWADKLTAFYGTITARGASQSPASGLPTQPSNGGFSEVSGKQTLIFRGQVDLSAPNGTIGTLLLDPVDIRIVAGGGGAQDAALPDISEQDLPATFTISQNALQSQAAAIVLEASNNITIDAGVSLNFVPGGDITFRANSDTIGGGSFSMDTSQTLQTAGRNLNISGANLTIGNIDTSSISPGTSTGGNVTLQARNTLRTGTINTSASATPPGVALSAIAGSVNLSTDEGSITTGAITTFANTAPGAVSTATGGNVTLTANSQANAGNIVFDSINTSAATATNSIGGSVNITAAGTIQGTATGDTIVTDSPSQSGSITIAHNGGSTNLPFTIGSASANGTAGALNAGGTTIVSSGSFAVQASPQSTVVGTGPNTITLTANNQAPTLAITSTLTGATANQPFSFTYNDLAVNLVDADADNTQLIITAVTSGTLTVNGTPVIANVTTLSPGDTLVYTPPPNTSGTIASAFTLQANDGAGNSPTRAVQVNVQPPVPPPVPTPPPNPEPNPQPNPEEIEQRVDLNPPLLPIIQSPPPLIATTLACSSTDAGVYTVEDKFTREFEEYLKKRTGNTQTRLLEACDALNQVETQTGVKPAIVYVSFVPGSVAPTRPTSPSQPKSILQLEQFPDHPQHQDTDQLELIVVIPNSRPLYKRVSGASRAEVLQVVRQFTTDLTDPTSRETDNYLASAQQLYQWLVQPIEPTLQAQKVKNLVFVMDAGLRSLPIAALHDGQQFLVEKYSLGLMPSLSITDTRYRDLKNLQVLAMGASTFSDQKPLPAVPVELATILQTPWAGETWLNQGFTLNNLKARRQAQPFGIVHLATHAEFNPGELENSYIQLWNTKLRLDQVRQLGWNDPPVQLLVLSACRTALGSEQAELGFAGLAYQTGVRSILASLWAVDDEGTLAFMTEFYQKLKIASIRAEALRQAQIEMLRGQVRVEQGKLVTPTISVPLPPELAQLEDKNLSAPFYWAAFTMIGNPW